MICAICGKPIEDEFGNNPYPVRLGEDDRCCDTCNMEYVVPLRIALAGADSSFTRSMADKLNHCDEHAIKAVCIMLGK